MRPYHASIKELSCTSHWEWFSSLKASVTKTSLSFLALGRRVTAGTGTDTSLGDTLRCFGCSGGSTPSCCQCRTLQMEIQISPLLPKKILTIHHEFPLNKVVRHGMPWVAPSAKVSLRWFSGELLLRTPTLSLSSAAGLQQSDGPRSEGSEMI